MGIVARHYLDLAASRAHTHPTRDRQSGSAAALPSRGGSPLSFLRGSFSPGAAPHGLPVRRARWRGSRWLTSAGRVSTPPTAARCPAVPSGRAALDALARTVAAVQAAHLIGEGAPTTGARGTFGGRS